MKRITNYFFILLLITFSVEAQVSITSNRAGGIFKTGETVRWTVDIEEEIELDDVRYQILKGGLELVADGKVEFSQNKAYFNYKFNKPGAVTLEVRWGKENDFNQMVSGGAIADPSKISLSATRPADFDQFWKEKIAELEGIPANPNLISEESTVEGIDYFKITMDNIRGTKIQGQIAKPAKGKDLPALLIVQWAGVYPLEKEWVLNRAKAGWLVLNINPHDLPIDNEPEFYKEQFKNDLNNYWAIGNDDRDKSYFLRMYLSCYRAADYLSGREDWNGKTLVVMGGSQGGQQALMTAGLYPGITAAIALVPAGFDMLGPQVGRKGGWPQWYDKTEGKDPNAVHKASQYYDVANFMKKIKCPVLVGIGLIDRVCPPEGIIAGLNQLKRKKEVIILERSAHQNKDGSQQLFYDRQDKVWLPVLKSGGKAPVFKK